MKNVIVIFLFVFLATILSSCGPAERNAMGQRAFGRGDYESALTWWLPLARHGYPGPQHNMGLLWEGGLTKKTPQNVDEAIVWYTMAANQGVALSMVKLGKLLNKKGNTDEAAHWYTQAARWGNVEAIGFFREIKIAPPPADLLYHQQELQRAQVEAEQAALAAALVQGLSELGRAAVEARNPPPAPPPQEIRLKTDCTKIGDSIFCH